MGTMNSRTSSPLGRIVIFSLLYRMVAISDGVKLFYEKETKINAK